jgi:hypothetical protein
MAVASTDSAATVQLSAVAALVAHQLVDHPGGDAGVLQPGGECVAQVVWAVQLQLVEPVGRVDVLVGPGDDDLIDAWVARFIPSG